MATYVTRDRKTPGVYVTEFSAFAPSVVGVATAIPIFVGYTECAGDPATGEPLYGQAVPVASMADYAGYFGGAATDGGFTLATQMALFYENGGGDCYVVSAGSYWDGQTPAAPPAPVPGDWTLATITAEALLAGLAVAHDTRGPTMLVVPDACLLDLDGYGQVACAMLAQAGALQDRMAILDLPGCLTATDYADLLTCQANFWTAIAPQAANGSYGAAYAPALLLPDGTATAPSAVVAGIWTKTDAQFGVWHAPANVSVAGVDDPQVKLSDDQQGAFNLPLNGMAIDIMRAMVNRGTVVWGARTLDGNSNDYRYVQVRRTFIYIEQSIKNALAQFVIAPNDATTWTTVTAAISNFLTQLWQAGGLMGDKASDAFTVACGVPSTMTEEDLLNGYMIVNVTLQMVHPAEFIVLVLSQKMQGA